MIRVGIEHIFVDAATLSFRLCRRKTLVEIFLSNIRIIKYRVSPQHPLRMMRSSIVIMKRGRLSCMFKHIIPTLVLEIMLVVGWRYMELISSTNLSILNLIRIRQGNRILNSVQRRGWWSRKLYSSGVLETWEVSK